MERASARGAPGACPPGTQQSAPAKGIEPSSPDRQSGRLARCVRGQLGQPWRAARRRRTRALVGSAPVFSSHEFSNSKAQLCADPRGARSNRPTMSSGGAPESRTPIDRLRAGCSAIELVPRANAVAVARYVVVMWDHRMLGQTSPHAWGARARAAPNAKKPPGGSPRRLLASCDERAPPLGGDLLTFEVAIAECADAPRRAGCTRRSASAHPIRMQLGDGWFHEGHVRILLLTSESRIRFAASAVCSRGAKKKAEICGKPAPNAARPPGVPWRPREHAIRAPMTARSRLRRSVDRKRATRAGFDS